jgi:long-chain acyl-CoA synthetase
MHPSRHARAHPERPAYVMAATGEAVTYGQLEQRSNQGAHLFRSIGCAVGDVVAIFLENHPRYFEVAWAAERSGLTYAAISSRLTAPEAEYIIKDCGARVLVTSIDLAPVIEAMTDLPAGLRVFTVGGSRVGFEDFEAARAAFPVTPITDEWAGVDMLYSSGTTGRPKGVKARPQADGALEAHSRVTPLAQERFGMDEDTVYLCPAPLYHAAPLRWSMAVQKLGGCVIVMGKFDPETALALIDRYKVTHAQCVPTHFVRMLKLPEATRSRYSLSSLKLAFHAGAPCPVPIKERMLAWWGPIIHEYYAGSEGSGITVISPQEWLTHKGSVGRPALGQVHICGPDGEPLPPRSEGAVYFSGVTPFEYHNDPQKTADSRNARGWTTLGDVGWVDEDGFLYLTDRKSFTIISGGVNIYPQEIENLLAVHPKVADAAVIGAPDEDLGEKVVAVVEPTRWEDAGDALASELLVYLRERLSSVKLPKAVHFRRELPREPTGKLFKRLIRDSYWADRTPPTR